MDKDPRRRFADARAFREALATIPIVDAPVPATAAAAPTATVPLHRGDDAPASDATTALPRRFKRERIALLGPLSPIADRLARIPRDPRLLIALVIALLALGFLFLRDTKPSAVTLPDVRGETVQDAAGELRLKGFKVSGYSYEVVTDADKVNRVISTIPAAGAEIAPGSSVHLLAGAVASTPPPVVENDDDDGGDASDDGGGDGARKARGKRKRD
jgi:hypothetical protein